MGIRNKPCGYQQIAAATLAAATALTVPAGADYAVIVSATSTVSWRDDGVEPTAAIGMPVAAGVPFAYEGDLSAIKFILITGSPVLHVSYYQRG